MGWVSLSGFGSQETVFNTTNKQINTTLEIPHVIEVTCPWSFVAYIKLNYQEMRESKTFS